MNISPGQDDAIPSLHWDGVAKSPTASSCVRASRIHSSLPLILIAVIAIGYYAAILAPGTTFTEKYVHDLFIYFDGASRISAGQIPHVDFHSALGALTYLFPLAGLLITQHVAGALEWSALLAFGLLATLSVLVVYPRHGLYTTLFVVVFIAIVVLVPANLGERQLSHAMFYNRWGWSALTTILLLYKTPERPDIWLDALVLALLAAFLLYLKITYFAVALGFLSLLFVTSQYGRALTGRALTLFVAALVFVELLFHLHIPYLRDILDALAASGPIQNGDQSVLSLFLSNITDYLLVLFAVSAAGWALKLRFQDYLAVTYVAVSSLLLMNQNYQWEGCLALLVIFIWCADRLYHAGAEEGQRDHTNSLSAPHLVAHRVVIMCMIIFAAAVLLPRLDLSFRYASELRFNLQDVALDASLRGFLWGESRSFVSYAAEGRLDQTVFNDLIRHSRSQELRQGEYMATVTQGMALLKAAAQATGPILVFDFANPFNMLLGRSPPKHDYTWFHSERNISEASFPKPESLLGAAQVVLIPVFPVSQDSRDLLVKLYGPYLDEHFDCRPGNAYWDLCRRSPG